MEFTPIVSKKGIKRLLLEEVKAINNGQKPRLIILSQKRFAEFVKRDDVRELSVKESDDLAYELFANKYAVKYTYYFVTFQYISGCYIVKKLCKCEKYWCNNVRTYYSNKLFDCDEYRHCDEESGEIAYIE